MKSKDIKSCLAKIRALVPDLKPAQCLELFAAYWGYKTAAEFENEHEYKIANLTNGEILIPNLQMIKRKMSSMRIGVLTCDKLADCITTEIKDRTLFTGELWAVHSLRDFLIEEFLPTQYCEIERALGAAVETTNAVFSHMLFENGCAVFTDRELRVSVAGRFIGETLPDKKFAGDEIEFGITLTFCRIACKASFLRPKIAVVGKVKSWKEYDLCSFG
jgi:hypothetical protein